VFVGGIVHGHDQVSVAAWHLLDQPGFLQTVLDPGVAAGVDMAVAVVPVEVLDVPAVVALLVEAFQSQDFIDRRLAV